VHNSCRRHARQQATPQLQLESRGRSDAPVLEFIHTWHGERRDWERMTPLSYCGFIVACTVYDYAHIVSHKLVTSSTRAGIHMTVTAAANFNRFCNSYVVLFVKCCLPIVQYKSTLNNFCATSKQHSTYICQIFYQ